MMDYYGAFIPNTDELFTFDAKILYVFSDEDQAYVVRIDDVTDEKCDYNKHVSSHMKTVFNFSSTDIFDEAVCIYPKETDFISNDYGSNPSAFLHISVLK